MTQDEKINSLIWPQVVLKDTNDKKELKREDIGGLFGEDEFRINARSLQRPENIRQKVQQVVDRTGSAMININYEGGNFTHINNSKLTQIISAMALGVADCTEDTHKIAKIIARELKAMGIVWNFAPVAELNKNPYFLSLGIRSFGGDPKKVARHVRAFVVGLQEEGVAATAKHFPGVAYTNYCFEDIYPLVTSKIEEEDMLPFRAAVKAGVSFIMPRHGIYTAIDAKNLSTLSRKFMDFLRKELDYNGVVITDSLKTGALSRLTKAMGLGDLSVAALRAGANCLLLESTISFGSTDPAVMKKIQDNYAHDYLLVHNAIKKAVHRGVIDIEESVKKVNHIIDQYALKKIVTPMRSKEIIGNSRSKKLSYDIARKSVRIVYNRGILPLKKGAKILVIRTERIKSNRADSITDINSSLELELKKYTQKLDTFTITSNKQIDKLSGIKKRYDAVVIESYFGYLTFNNLDIQSRIIKKTNKLWPEKMIYIIKGIPLELISNLTPAAVILTYDVRQPSLKAAAECIFQKRVINKGQPIKYEKGKVHSSLCKNLTSQNRVIIVMPTKGGKWIEPTIDCLTKEVKSNKKYNIKLIIGINSSTKKFEKDAQKLQNKYKFILKKGPDGKFNTVAHIVEKYTSETDFIVCIDDDVIPSRGSLISMLESVKRSSNASFLVGAIPIPITRVKSQNKTQRFWREALSINRNDRLGYFKVPAMPWGQFIAMHKDQYPVIKDKFPLTTNDSFFYLATFFPNITIAPRAYYYYLPSDNPGEYLRRKARIQSGIQDVLSRVNIPLVSHLNYYLRKEREIKRDIKINKTAKLASYLKVNELASRKRTKRWLTPTSTKMGRFNYLALYNSSPRIKKRKIDFIKLATKDISISSKEAIYLME